MADQFASTLNDALWTAIQRKSGNRAFCVAMAAVAKDLDRMAEAPKRFAGWTAEGIARLLKRSSFEQKIARKLAEAVADKVASATLWPRLHFTLTARYVRICGVWTCVDGGLDLRGCECFKDLAENATKESIKEALLQKLNHIC